MRERCTYSGDARIWRAAMIMTEWTNRATAFLFGRKTYEIFAGSWPKSTEETVIFDSDAVRPVTP